MVMILCKPEFQFLRFCIAKSFVFPEYIFEILLLLKCITLDPLRHNLKSHPIEPIIQSKLPLHSNNTPRIHLAHVHNLLDIEHKQRDPEPRH